MLKERIKKYISKKTESNSKKSIENLIVFLVLLIITVIAINIIWGKDEKKKVDSNYKVLADDLKIENSNNPKNLEYDLEADLEDILSKMQGVGKVDVLITYSESSSVIPMYSETESTSLTEETDSNGGTRKQESTNIGKEVVTDGSNNAITKTVVLPKIEGAIVIAEGGSNINIKSNIIQAVAAVTGIATYKVQVFEMSK